MEFLNKLELKGVVGRADVNTYNGTAVCNLSVVTEYSCRDKDGNPAVETNWVNVSAWEGRGMPDLYQIKKGCWVAVKGRLRQRRYTTQENEEKQTTEVIARSLEIIPREEGDEHPQPQRDY